MLVSAPVLEDIGSISLSLDPVLDFGAGNSELVAKCERNSFAARVIALAAGGLRSERHGDEQPQGMYTISTTEMVVVPLPSQS